MICLEGFVRFAHEMNESQAVAYVAPAARTGASASVRWTFKGTSHTATLPIEGTRTATAAVAKR